MDSNSDKRGAPSRGPGRIVDKARAFVRKMKEAKVLKRTKAVVMTSLLGASSVMSAAAPMAAYAVEPRSSSTPAGTGWYYLVANGSDAVNGFVLNLEGCRSGTGVNAFVTDQHRGNESMLKMAENMWYVQDVGGGWFTIRNVHGYALSANEDGHDNLPTASYNSGDAAQKWHIDGGKLVAQNGDTMKLANGLTQGSPVCDQNNRSSQDVTWSFERVSVQGKISGYSQKQNVGTKITTPTFDPGAHIGYTKTDNPDMDANRSAGVKVSFAVKNGDGAERGLPYTISDSDKGKTISLIAHVKSAFGAEMWTTTFDMTVNETHEEGSTGGQQGGQVGVDPGGVGEEGGQINNPGGVQDGIDGNTWVGRWDNQAMHDRNRIVLNGDATLTDADIKLINIDSKIIEDTAINTQETGHNKEYVIDVSDVEDGPSSAGIEATYRNIGTDPITGRSISVQMRMTNFQLTAPGYIELMNTAWQLPRSNEEIKGEGNVPPYEDPNAIFYKTPNIRLAANFDGGYWMNGVEKVTIDYYFYYDNDPTQAVDLTNAFMTVQSLDHDGNGLSWNGQALGQEAVMPNPNKYDHVLLTPSSAVGRWGDLTGFSGKTYPSSGTDNQQASAFYNPTPTTEGKVASDLAVTLYGVKDGSNHFVFDMIDTGANTHNMPYFGTIGTVYPPDPVKYVKDKETGDWVDFDDGYLLDSTTQFKVEQFIPGRDEQLGNYKSVSFTDTISDDLEVTDFHVYREDGSEVTSGTKQLGNNLKYDFDLGAEDVYGHTYSFVIDVKVVDYPEGSTLIIPNSAQTHFGASNGMLDMQTNEVKIELINPELRVWKEIVIDDDASVINDYEYLIGDVITYDAYVINENAGTRAKDVTFYDHLPDGLDYIEGSIMVTDANGNTVNVADDGNGWKLTFTNFDYNKPVKVRYQAYATEAGNGTEVINRAKAWAVNVPKDVDGNETQEAWNESEAYINDPNLKVLKSVTQSEIQNPDYQQGEEYRVGDTFRYTVTVVNTEPGTFAENVIITDDQLPEGFELVGGPTVTGLDENGFPKTIEFPKHFDDDKHGQHETHKIQWSTKPIKHDDTGSWGWEVDVNFLAYGMTCSVTWEVRATDAMNGYEVYNRAWAKAENQPNDTFWSTDDSSDETRGNEYTVVWINNPEFVIDKSVRKTDQAYQIGDVAAYDIEVKGLKTPGTLARETTLDDEFLQEGTTIIENSFIITDKPTEDQPQDISDQVELNRYVGKQGWHIDMTQVYGDTHGYWVNSEDWRPIYKDGVDGRVDGEHNPVKTKPEYDKEDCESDDVDYAHDYFKVHYEATINDMALQNEIIHNEATIDSIESFPVTDDAEVTAIGAQLMINKDSNDGGGFTVGDVAEYEITITNNATGTVAENVQIKDGFTTAMPGTVSIVEGSIKVYDNQNKQLLIAPSQITYTRNESGNIFGFQIDTGYDLPSSQKLTVRYDVKYLANNGGQVITNVAYTWADNAPEVNDPYETWPDDMDQSDLRLDKGSDKQVYDSDGDFGTYTLNIVNHSDETALNVTINDDITTDTLGIAQIVQGSVSVWDHHGDAVSWDRLVYHYANGGQIKGFTIYTDHDLEPNERMQVVYQVRFDKTAQQTQVHNEAWASADNTGKANDDNDVTLNPGGGDDGTTIPDDPDPEWPPHNPDPDPGDPELAIVKESNKNWFVPGEQGHYSLRVTNPEYGTTAENVVVTDTLDADARKYASIIEGSVKVTDAMGNAVAVENTSYEKDREGRVWGIKIATGYDLAYGGALNVTYDVKFDGDINGQVDVHNAATADADNTPPADTDHVVHLDTEGTPELVLDKSADKTEVAPGDTLTYTVAVSQPAEGMTVKDVVITDTLPEGFELDQASVKVEKDGRAQTVSAEFPAGKLRVKLGDVAYGEKWVVTYSGTVSEDFLGDELHNVVVGESPDIPEDPEDETTTPIHKPRLQIEKVASAHQVKPGDDLDWTITVVQTMRGATATNTVVTDQLPDGYVAESADVVVTDALGNPRNEHHTLVNGLLTVQLGDLAYNDPVIITIHGKVRDDFGGERLTNTAVADADNVPDPVDDTDEALLGAKLEIEKVADRDYAQVGGELNWEITVTQVTPEAVAKNAVVTDELPDGFVATAADVTVADARGNDRTRTCSITLEDGKLTVGLGDLAYNDPLTITIHGKVAEDFEGDSILNKAIADADNIPDPVEDEDEVSLTPRLAIEKTADRKTANPGDRLTWSIRVSQIVEGATAHNVVMTDELPDGFTADRDLIAVVDADGNAWTDARVHLNEDDELTVELGDMEYGHDATILVPGTISDDYDDDTMTNVAVADADDVPEPVDDDETVDFGDVPPLDIIKDADRVLVSPGDRVNYTVTTTVGNGALKNVIVADDIPDGLTLDEDSLKAYVNGVPFDTTGKLTIKDGDILLAVGDLAARDVVKLTYRCTVDDDVLRGSALKNVATATAEGTDPVRDDETVRTPGDVPPLEIVKEADRTEVVPGQTVGYTVTTTVGDGDLDDVTVTDVLPDGLSLVDGSVMAYINGAIYATDGHLTVEGQTLTLDAGDRRAGDEIRITYSCTVDDDVAAGTSLKNVATAEADGVDPVDDDATVTNPGENPPLTIDKTADKSTVQAGDKVGYTITTKASGDLTNVVVTDDVPMGLTVDEASVKATLNGEDFATDGKLTFDNGDFKLVVGTMKAGDTLVITYTATVDANVTGGSQLTNTAIATADGVDPVTDTATVTVPCPENPSDGTPSDGTPSGNNPSGSNPSGSNPSGSTGSNGYTDIPKDLGKNLGKTGDVLAQFLPAIVVGMAIICLGCVALYNREEIRGLVQRAFGARAVLAPAGPGDADIDVTRNLSGDSKE